jgi:precorrin-2 dehydrogenase/sirohydrochlorin ferrochelatase
MGYMVNLVLDGRPAVVIGGGAVATRKIGDLLAAGARITVIAPDPSPELQSMADRGLVAGRWGSYRAEDLDGAFVAIAATDDETVNAQVAQDARARNVLVNVVDRPALCTFTLPAVGRRGHLMFGVATDGLSPSLSGVLRDEILERYGPEYAELVSLIGDLRKRMIALGWNGRRIMETVADMYQAGIAGVLSSGDRKGLEEFLRARLGPEFPLPLRGKRG